MGNSNSNTKNLINLYLLDKIIKHPVEMPKMKNNKIYFIQKTIVDRYKDLYYYKEIIKILENDKNILNNNIELNEDNILDIIPKEIKHQFEEINKELLLKNLTYEHNNKWNYKSLTFGKFQNIKYIDDFEIIDHDLKKFFKEQKFKVLKGKYIIGTKGIFIYIRIPVDNKSELSVFEIGNFDENGNFNIQYLLDQNEIDNPSKLIDALVDKGIDSIFNELISQEKKDIKFKIFLPNFPYNFYIFNDINNDNISMHTIINNTTLNESSSLNQSNIMIEANLNGIIKQEKDSMLKPNNKLECLIYLSIFQKLIIKNNSEIQKVFLMNTKYLEQFYFNEIEELINKNEEIKKIIDNNKNINDLSLNLVVAYLLKDNRFQEIKNKISSINSIYTSHIYEGEDFNLTNNKKIKIFKSFIIINEALSKDFEKHFGIKFIKSYISYISIKKSRNENDKLIIHDNQYTIFIYDLNNECHIYNIDYILNFDISNNMLGEFNALINKGCSDYIFEHNIFDKYGKKEYIFPIFSKSNALEIIGYGYKYKDLLNFGYEKVIDYSKYLNNEILINNLSLFIYYEKIKNKKSNNFEKLYLINYDFMNNIKIENNYKLLKDNLDENIKEVKILDDNKKDIYSLLKIISSEILENYFSKKINYNKNKSQYNTAVEPLMTTFNYFDSQNRKQNSLYIYNNFEIFDKEIMKLFFDTYANNSYLYDCFFEKGKIIINLPNNLNNKTISLVGSLDNYYNYFVLEYIFIYNNDKDRINHFNIILGRLEKYLGNLKFNKNNAPITLRENSDIIGTAIKYGKDNDNDNAIIPDSLKKNFESCPHIGLQNIGATCYMNSTLQCFCHIEKFVEFFKYNPQITNNIKNEKDKLSFSFKLLIDNLWPDNFNPSSPKFKKYYSPEDFKNKISKLNPLFEGIAANDAKDLVNFII